MRRATPLEVVFINAKLRSFAEKLWINNNSLYADRKSKTRLIHGCLN